MAIAVVVAVAIGLIGGHAFPDYDATFALIWGRDILHGRAPDYLLPYRPAGHPLTTFAGVLGEPLGRAGAAEFLRWLALLGAGAFVASAFRLGQTLFGTLAGALAALLLATRAPLWGFSELAFMDAWAAALVVWAATLEVRTPRRGAPVLVLLAFAGLIRPEVWLFAAVYWVWIALGSTGRAVRLLPLAALGPVIWIAWDLATAQTFLGSVSTATGLPVATSSAGHGLDRAPGALARYIGGFVRPPELIAAAAGLLLLARAEWRRALIPGALITINVAAFAIVAERNGPIEQRYLLIACAMLLVLAAYAIACATPRMIGIVLAIACLAYAPVDIGRIVDLRNRVGVSDAIYSDLRDVVEAHSTRCALGGHVHVDDVRLRPFIAYWGAISPRQIDTEAGGSGELVALDPAARELSSRSLPAGTGSEVTPPPHWRLTGSCAGQ